MPNCYLGRTDEAIVLLQKSLERNPTYGGAQLFLMTALSLTGRRSEAVSMAKKHSANNIPYPKNKVKVPR